MKKLVFITNDDGIYAAGLAAIETSLFRRGVPFFTSAPLYENSGAGHSITLEKPLRVKKFNENRYAVIGTPTDAVFLGLHSLLKDKPVFALSGINKGANLGNDITYSGTVAAAIETYYNGITSFAVSLYISDFASFSEETYVAASEILFEVIIPEIEKKIGKQTLYRNPHLFNINIPDLIKNGKIPEIKWTTLGKRNYGGDVIRRFDPRGNEYFWIGGNQHLFADIEGSDCNAMKDGFISISPISLSFSNHEILAKMNNNYL